MVFTGAKINSVAAVGGVMSARLSHRSQTGTFRVESFVDANDMLRHIAGAALRYGRRAGAGLHHRSRA